MALGDAGQGGDLLKERICVEPAAAERGDGGECSAEVAEGVRRTTASVVPPPTMASAAGSRSWASVIMCGGDARGGPIGVIFCSPPS
ncbi:hypothetical protein QP150_12815 [Sphingomonas sp. 22L2VL55-3]